MSSITAKIIITRASEPVQPKGMCSLLVSQYSEKDNKEILYRIWTNEGYTFLGTTPINSSLWFMSSDRGTFIVESYAGGSPDVCLCNWNGNWNADFRIYAPEKKLGEI